MAEMISCIYSTIRDIIKTRQYKLCKTLNHKVNYNIKENKNLLSVLSSPSLYIYSFSSALLFVKIVAIQDMKNLSLSLKKSS